jgi:hypothetical protein
VKRRIPRNTKKRLLIINDNQQHLRRRRPLAFAASALAVTSSPMPRTIAEKEVLNKIRNGFKLSIPLDFFLKFSKL